MENKRPILTPDILPTRANRTAHEYGCDLLALILRLDCEVYGLLSNDDLALIDHVAHTVVCAPQISPLAVSRISDIRHRVLHVLKVRTTDAATATLPPTKHDDRPNLGPMARLVDPPIVRPPSPAIVRPEPVQTCTPVF